MSVSTSIGVGGIAPDPDGVFRLPLERTVLRRRYNRFLADVERTDGSVITVHVPNTGSMATLNHPGCDAWIAAAANPNRKLAWTLTLVGTPGGGLAIVDTQWPNRLVAAGITAGRVPALTGYAHLRREVVFGSRGSRADIALTGHATQPDALIEVKNVTMLGAPGRADFPDAVSERGQKHLAELADVAQAGGRAVQFYCLSRTDCAGVGLAEGIDPAYAAAARRAAAVGVQFHAHRVVLQQQDGVTLLGLGPEVPVDLGSA